MVIIGELNMTVPRISMDEIDKFLDKTKLAHDNHLHLSHEEKTYVSRNSRVYPWDRRILEYKGRVFFAYNTTPPFSELDSLIKSLPIKPDTRVVALLRQKTQMYYDFNWHFDGDNEYGFRICLGLDTRLPFLEVAKLKEEYGDYNANSKKIESHMVEPNIFKIIPRDPNTVLLINGSSYAHRVPVNGATNRCSIIVRGDLIHKNFSFKQFIQD